MKYIDITEKLEEFYRHLNEKKFNRTIFSAKFGDGKTEFLHQFKEKYKAEYTFYTLYPVNYQIAPNEQIMEYIKRDLLFQLIKNNTLAPIANISKSVLLQWYLNENPLDIMKSITKCAFTILGKGKLFNDVVERTIKLLKEIDNECKDFKKFEEGIKKGDFEKATEIIGKLSEGAGNIYELDSISYLIAKSIINQDKKSVLIIEDLDRIDPAHLFRILNIFSAHIDREYLCSENKIFKAGEEVEFDRLPNKFGFDKIIFVMDADATKRIFKKFYGNANYEGYISKFFSKCIFEYSITEYAQSALRRHIEENCGEIYDIIYKGLKNVGIDLRQKSVRDISKALYKFEKSYIRTRVEEVNGFRFLSDTPLIKLLATLERLGIMRSQFSSFLKAIESNEIVIALLGCFAMDKYSFHDDNVVYYDSKLYKMDFSLDLNWNNSLLDVKGIPLEKYPTTYKFLEINIDIILKKALRYVN